MHNRPLPVPFFPVLGQIPIELAELGADKGGNVFLDRLFDNRQ